MSINELYQELIIDHGSNPRNFKSLNNPNATAESYNPTCGDKIILYLEITDNKIINAGFQGHGCAISTASASIMTELLIGKTLQQANNYLVSFIKSITTTNNPEQDPNLAKKLLALTSVKNFPSRVKCATLAWHTLKAALKNQINRSP